MAKSISIQVEESVEELKTIRNRQGLSAHLRVRLKMLILMLEGVNSVKDLSARTGANRDSILGWKHLYNKGGLTALLSEGRGGDMRSGITAAQKEQIADKLNSPKNSLRTYKEAQQWLKEELGIDKSYHAVNAYLKRNFGTKLKVGRKSHTQKDETATADYKKLIYQRQTY
jgi:transposase